MFLLGESGERATACLYAPGEDRPWALGEQSGTVGESMQLWLLRLSPTTHCCKKIPENMERILPSPPFMHRVPLANFGGNRHAALASTLSSTLCFFSVLVGVSSLLRHHDHRRTGPCRLKSVCCIYCLTPHWYCYGVRAGLTQISFIKACALSRCYPFAPTYSDPNIGTCQSQVLELALLIAGQAIVRSNLRIGSGAQWTRASVALVAMTSDADT